MAKTMLEIYRFLDEQLGYSDELIAAVMGMTRPTLYAHKLNGFQDIKLKQYEAAVTHLRSIRQQIDNFLSEANNDTE